MAIPQFPGGSIQAPRTLFMGSYPPRECGIATFTKDTVDSFDARFDTKSEIIAIDEPGGEMRVYPPEVTARLVEEDRNSYSDVAAIVNAHPCELFNVQHEYGLFGGTDGELFLEVLQGVTKPTAVTLHTVLPEPNDHHLHVAQEIARLATTIIVLSQTGKDILVNRYGVDPDKIRVIHHGVPDVPFRSTDTAKAAFGVGQRMVISTFGLISKGKGIEFAIEAMRCVVKSHPEALYLVLGQTHPVVRRQEGESYRESLTAIVAQNGLQNNVQFVDRYLDFNELVEYLQATDIYCTPYLNPVQIVSGTLAYAVGVGKAVVSTPYLYAEELLSHHRGCVVPFRDASSLGDAIVALLGDPGWRRAIERRAYRFGRQMTWPNVAFAYGRLFSELVPTESRAELATSA